MWLIQNNKYFSEYVIDEEILERLPEDDIPVEIMGTVHQETNTDMVEKECEAYTCQTCKYVFHVERRNYDSDIVCR